MPQRTFSDTTRALNRALQKNGRLQQELDEASITTEALKAKYNRLKKAYKVIADQGADANSTKIARPQGQAGRKTKPDKNGRVRSGFNIRDEMGLSDTTKQRELYNDIRRFLRSITPTHRYKTYKDLSSTVLGNISVQAVKEFPMLKRFQGEWPVEVIVQDYYSNLTSTSNDKASGAYRRRQNRRNRREDGERSDGGAGAGGDDREEDDAEEEEEEEEAGGGGGSGDNGEAGGDGDAVEENLYAGGRRQSDQSNRSGRSGSDDEGHPVPESPPAAKRRRLNNSNTNKSKATGKLTIL